MELQTSLGMLTAADAGNYVRETPDEHGRQPFYHPATQTVEVLNGGGKAYFMHHKQMSGVAARYGLPEVVRWQPRNVSTEIEHWQLAKTDKHAYRSMIYILQAPTWSTHRHFSLLSEHCH